LIGAYIELIVAIAARQREKPSLCVPRKTVHSLVMLNRLFGDRRALLPVVASQPSTSPETRLYAIGDIHGSLGALRLLHERIREHAERSPTKNKYLIYLGDYIDRGMDSRAVLEQLLTQPLPGFEFIYLKGNHEEGLLRFLFEGDNALGWLTYGGISTIYSYGAKPPDPLTDPDKLLKARIELAAMIPQAHIKFLTELRLTYTDGDYLFVHAGLKPGVPLDQQRESDLLWIRDEFLEATTPFEKVVVHGHSIAPQPDFHRNRIGIDTAAFASGRLTCLVLEGTQQDVLTS
jgi:serine/threonine protein phosphatase 1